MVAAKQKDLEVDKENQELERLNALLREQYNSMFNTVTGLKQEKHDLLREKELLKQSTIDLTDNLKVLEIQAQDAATAFYNSKMETAQTKLDIAIKEIENAYSENVLSFQNEYDETMQELIKEFQTLSNGVQEMKLTHAAAVEAAKRAEEMKSESDFYRMQLSSVDQQEIQALRSIEPYLRNSEPLNKIIWKCYYEKPATDMIGRVVGSNATTGIYKITEIESGKCYVGQAVNIADRWKQHIKRGVGAETPTRNKLYPAMNAIGPENFTFEVIEVCERSRLDEREDFWQDYFKAKEFGYSIK